MFSGATKVRPPAVASQFYPSNPEQLRRDVQNYIAAAKPSGAANPKAIIAPHAGYMYSGPIAGSAFACLAASADVVRRIILVGPSHYVAFRGLAVSSAAAFATTLGQIQLDKEAIEQIRSLPQVKVSDQAHADEHSLEVELPFLQVVLKEFTLVPLVAGDATDEEVAEVLDRLWDGTETRIVISSDLSHYLDYKSASQLDRATAQAIESLKPDQIDEHQACGRVPVRGLLKAARKHGLRPQTIDLRNSGDTAGRKDRVVGYGAFVFS